MTISILEFIKTGKFGPIAIGADIAILEHYFGQPDSKKEFGNNRGAYIYGGFEFLYIMDSNSVYAIVCEDLSNSFPKDLSVQSLCINNKISVNMDVFSVRENHTYRSIKNRFDELSLVYKETVEKFWNKMVFKSGVEFLFNNNYEYPEDHQYDINTLHFFGFRNFPVFDLSINILNTALNLSMEFGDHWLKDVKERLKAKYPSLSEKESKKCNSISKKVNAFAHKQVVSNSNQNNTFLSKIEFEKILLKKYNWISKENIAKLYSQSCYYAMK